MRPTLTRHLRHTRPLLNSLSPLAKELPVSKQEHDNLRVAFDNVMSNTENSSTMAQQAQDRKNFIFDSAFHAVDREEMRKNLMETKLVGTNIQATLGTLAYNHSNTKDRSTTGRSSIARMKETRIAVKRSLEYVQSHFKTDYELCKYIESKVLELDAKFAKKSKSHKSKIPPFTRLLVEAMKKQSALSPGDPLINEYTMSIILAEAIKVLSESYKSPDAALSLFHFAKEQSLKTYIYTCTIGVYNEVFRCHWKYYKSVSALLELINELKVNGIQGSAETCHILAEASKEAHIMLLNDDDDGVSFEFSLERGPEKWTQLWNKSDEDDLKAVDQYRHDLISVVMKQTGHAVMS